jgi:hypothetical protein
MYYVVNTSFEKTVKAQTAVNSAAIAKERESNFLQTYEKTASKWEELQGIFIDSNKVVNFIESVEQLGSQSGSKVSIRSIEADNLDNAPSGKEGTVRLRINSQGSWQSVMKALSLAEVLPYKVSVNNVQATVSKDGAVSASSTASRNIWDLNFELQAAMILVSTTSPSIK